MKITSIGIVTKSLTQMCLCRFMQINMEKKDSPKSEEEMEKLWKVGMQMETLLCRERYYGKFNWG